MDETTRQQALLTALSDQSRAVLHEWLPDMQRIVDQSPSSWTETDRQIIRGTLSAVMGLIYEGRI